MAARVQASLGTPLRVFNAGIESLDVAKEFGAQRAGLAWELGGRWRPHEVDRAALSDLLARVDAVARA